VRRSGKKNPGAGALEEGFLNPDYDACQQPDYRRDHYECQDEIGIFDAVDPARVKFFGLAQVVSPGGSSHFLDEVAFPIPSRPLSLITLLDLTALMPYVTNHTPFFPTEASTFDVIWM